MFPARQHMCLALIAIASVALAGCSKDTPPATSPAATTAAAPRLALSAKANLYAPNVFNVVTGRRYRIQIMDITEEHTFTVSPFDVNILLSGPGTQDLDLDVPPSAIGDVPFFCSLHVGMAGTLRIASS